MEQNEKNAEQGRKGPKIESLQKAAELLRQGQYAALESIFYLTHTRVYFLCKTIFASREAVLDIMRAFYLSLREAFRPNRAYDDYAACQDAMDMWLFNLCKKTLRENDAASFQPGGDDPLLAARFMEAAKAYHEENGKGGGKAPGHPAGIPADELLRKWLLELCPEQRLLFLMYFDLRMRLSDIAGQLRTRETYAAAQLWRLSETAYQRLRAAGAFGDEAEHSTLAAAGMLLRPLRRLKTNTRLNDDTLEALWGEIHGALPAPSPKRAAGESAMPYREEEIEPDEEGARARLNLRMILRSAAITAVAAAIIGAAIWVRMSVLRKIQEEERTRVIDYSFLEQSLAPLSGYSTVIKTTETITVPTLPPYAYGPDNWQQQNPPQSQAPPPGPPETTTEATQGTQAHIPMPWEQSQPEPPASETQTEPATQPPPETESKAYHYTTATTWPEGD
ncbi:MAG: hypothetical protein FWH26_05340 [Oscillospiraceae bacterium]|nr:hypothetical protein [Oscillospiraceae bacterium]